MKTSPLLSVLIVTLLAMAGSTHAQLASPGPAAKPKLMGMNEKKFVKDTTDSMYLMTELIAQTKSKARTNEVKQLNGKVKKDLDKMWAEVAGFASIHGEVVASTLKGSDKVAAERLQKEQGDAWDKEYLKVVTREVRRLNRAFESARLLQDAELRTIAEKWAATVATYTDEFERTEKEAGKTR